MRRLTRKRLEWLLALTAFPFNAYLGSRHFDRYGGHPWKADPKDRLDAAHVRKSK